MVRKPPLPDGYELPEAVNGWQHNPESNKNGHAWYSENGETAVAVFSRFGKTYVTVTDERCNGLGRGERIHEHEYECEQEGETVEGEERRAIEARAVSDAVETAVAWMDTTGPDQWTHPDVCEAVFDAPAGYELEFYFLEQRETTVYYRREDADEKSRRTGAGEPDEYTVETCPYLYLHQWNGSGNATVALAPWLYGHGVGSKHTEIEPVVETPDECGLEVALTMARQFAREHFGSEEIDATGQADIGRWSA